MYTPKVYFSKVYFSRCIFPKCINPKCIFASLFNGVFEALIHSIIFFVSKLEPLFESRPIRCAKKFSPPRCGDSRLSATALCFRAGWIQRFLRNLKKKLRKNCFCQVFCFLITLLIKCLNVHKSRQPLFQGLGLGLCHCLFVDQVMSPPEMQKAASRCICAIPCMDRNRNCEHCTVRSVLLWSCHWSESKVRL